MSSNKVKVVGYAQRIFYNDGIEYRNFSPDLVGVQLASDGGTPLMTMGNFSITTNLDPKSDKTFITNKFSNFVTLADLNLTVSQTNTLLTDNAEVNLNLDKSKLGYYATFGSLSEFVRVSLEDIITNWPASLYLTPLSQTTTGVMTGYTFENYIFDPVSRLSSFKVNTNFINNKFAINYTLNGNIINTFNAANDLRNLTVSYDSYSILVNDNEFPVVSFTAATNEKNDYIYFVVSGDTFSGQPSSSNINYHIKPKKIIEEQFFNALPDFEYYLLNRQILPKYTADFKYPTKSDDGLIIYVTDTITWPVTDGYNIDFDTTAYIAYATKLLDIANNSDLFSSDLMYRFLVSESITNFDTSPVVFGPLDQDTSGQKMTKTLRIYGREFDEINKFITGIEFANTVTYNKQDNTPDVYLKNLARVLGWDLISSVIENDLLSNYVSTAPSTYTGMTVGYTPEEADIELWRRIILNTPWIWKSKGARKSIEFLLRFIGAPQGLIKFNEYIYKAEAPIDIDLFRQVLVLNGLDPDLSLYPIDSNGYPAPLSDTPDMYFQNNGLWYRETGGSGSTIDILTGNNPHVGPYDGGFKYINQFEKLIPNFSAVTISSETITTGTTNLFTNYNLGEITNYSGATYVDATYDDGSSLADCVVVTSSIITDPMPTDTTNDCGCSSIGDDDALSICVDVNENISNIPIDCTSTMSGSPIQNSTFGVYLFNYYQYNSDGSIYTNDAGPVLNNSPFINPTCCRNIGGTPFLVNQTKVVSGNTVTYNTGYACCYDGGECGCKLACKWTVSLTPILLPVSGSSQNNYLVFSDGSSQRVVTPEGCNCIGGVYTTSVPNVLDPYTGEIGTACQVTDTGMFDLTVLGMTGDIYLTYLERNNGTIGCFDVNSSNLS